MGKDICPWFNIKAGCTRNSCSKKHVCAKVPAIKKDCCGRRLSLIDCKEKSKVFSI